MDEKLRQEIDELKAKHLAELEELLQRRLGDSYSANDVQVTDDPSVLRSPLGTVLGKIGRFVIIAFKGAYGGTVKYRGAVTVLAFAMAIGTGNVPDWNPTTLALSGLEWLAEKSDEPQRPINIPNDFDEAYVGLQLTPSTSTSASPEDDYSGTGSTDDEWPVLYSNPPYASPSPSPPIGPQGPQGSVGDPDNFV